MKISLVKRFLPAVMFAALLVIPVHSLKAQDTGSTSASAGRESTPEAQSPAKDKQEEDENDKYRHSDTVRALGSKMGLDAEQAATAFTALNFVVLAVLVGFGLLKTLPKLLKRKRRRKPKLKR